MRDNRMKDSGRSVKALILRSKVPMLPLICLQITSSVQGRNWVILKGDSMYIYKKKDEIIHGLGPSVICDSI